MENFPSINTVMSKMHTDKSYEQTTMKIPSQLNLLATPLFVGSISLLALNDFILKGLFHNWFTGKLSDIAGLIAFTLFTCAILPSRRWVIAVTISTGFILWKSPYSQPIIDFINIMLPFSIGRVPDYTDCLALPVVWLVCRYICRLRPWPMRSWMLGATAVFSLFMFSATSSIPMKRVTRTATIPSQGSQSKSAVTDINIQDLFDNIAVKHGLHCMVCDPLTNGRLYVKNEDNPSSFALAVYLDDHQSSIFYDLSSIGTEANKNAPEIETLQTEIKNQFQTLFPDVKIEKGKRHRGKTMQLGVRKNNSETTYDAQENQDDYDEAIKVIASVVSKHGFKQSTSGRNYVVFFTGKLFGPRPSDHELVVSAGIADWPLVPIDVTAYSPEYSELQRQIVDELEQNLQTVFGKERAWVR